MSVYSGLAGESGPVGTAIGSAQASGREVGAVGGAHWDGGVVARLAHWAATVPDQPAVGFVADPVDGVVEQLTYAELDARARGLAQYLRSRIDRGDRVLLLFAPSPGFPVAFVGCLYAGLVPVVAPVPDGQRHRGERLRGVVDSAGAACVLTDAATLPDIRQWTVGVGAAGLRVVAVDTDVPTRGTWTVPDFQPDDPAFLQYTSGSTSQPRGVVVTHGNIAANAELCHRLTGCDRDSRFGGWLPMHHDFGLLFLLLFPLYTGARTVHMSASVFLRRPWSWLHLIDRFRLDLVPAPNFGFELCLRRVTPERAAGLDLSSWRVAVMGAEPVQPETLRGFVDRFAPQGFRAGTLSAGYGLAESTLMVTCEVGAVEPVVGRFDAAALERGDLVPVPGSPTTLATPSGALEGATGPVRELVRCGLVEESDADTRIVDPADGGELPDGRVGELWLRGPSVAAGYWGDPEGTERVFGGLTAAGEGGFLRTGDLAVRFEGGLYFVGRIKEMMIIHGRNLYPQDVEYEARLAEEALRGLVGAAFSVPVPEERVVLVHEVRPGDAAGRMPEVAAAVRRRVAEEFGVALAGLLLVRPGAVRRTTSGKVRRGWAREAFLRGELRPLFSEVSAEARAVVGAAAGELAAAAMPGGAR